MDNLREIFSTKNLLHVYREIRGTVEHAREELKHKDSIAERAKYLRELIYREDEFAVTALVDINLSFESGEFSAVAGPSGSGKSTLLNIVATLEQPTFGKIVFQGRDLEDLSEDDRAEFRLQNLGFVFQAFNLIPVLSAFENIEYALILKRIPREERRARAKEALAFVGLSDCSHRRPNKLSGGQQQRVAIARALAVHPKLILADEPTANLDSKTATQILDLMGQINREKGTTFIFSSHDPLVLSRARRVVHLRDGAIIKTDDRSNQAQQAELASH
ncbi:MAG: ABC transporter ATP-binding protein [Elusimicrobia bacterium]|nr:ABC transporter ATP-binding protein [Elusimicrobiota bacterium]